MPSRFQIREAVVKFLYCADLKGGTAFSASRDQSWDFVTESDRRRLYLDTFRNVHFVALDFKRETRLVEFVERQSVAVSILAAWPQAESLKTGLERMAELESRWSSSIAILERLPKDDDDESVEERFGDELETFFRINHDLVASRKRFLQDLEDFPELEKRMEAVVAAILRLQRISDLIGMIEEPENYPERANLAPLRKTKAKIKKLRQKADELVDSIIARKENIDETLAGVVENFASERIDPVDRAILRLATHEILHTATPPKVAITEAIDLAKRFGTTDSGRFVNGVLDRIARTAAGKSGS